MRKLDTAALARMSAAELRTEARQRVIAIRGSDDVPAFDLCVEAELREMKQSLTR